MKNSLFACIALFFTLTLFAQTDGEIVSPDNRLSLKVFMNKHGELFYTLLNRETVVIETSRLGVKFKEGAGFETGMKRGKVTISEKNETWQPVWGEESSINNHYKELKASVSATNGLHREH